MTTTEDTNPGDTILVRATPLTHSRGIEKGDLVVGVEDQFFGLKFPHEYVVDDVIIATYENMLKTEPSDPDAYVSLLPGGREYVEPFVIGVRGDAKFRITI